VFLNVQATVNTYPSLCIYGRGCLTHFDLNSFIFTIKSSKPIPFYFDFFFSIFGAIIPTVSYLLLFTNMSFEENELFGFFKF